MRKIRTLSVILSELEDEKEFFCLLKESKNKDEVLPLLEEIEESFKERDIESADKLIDRLFEDYIFEKFRAPTIEKEPLGEEPIISNTLPKIEKIIEELKSEEE